MKATVLYEYNEPLVIEEIEIDEPRRAQVMVRTVSTGVCHSDLSRAEGLNPTELPAVLGHAKGSDIHLPLGGLARQSSRHGCSPVGAGPAHFGELGTDEPLISASSVWSMRMAISFPAFGSPETRCSSMDLWVCSTYPALPRRCPPYMSVRRSLVA